MPGRGRPKVRLAGPAWAINVQPTQARFIEMSRTHNALVRSFQCINMKLLILVTRWAGQTGTKNQWTGPGLEY